MSAIKKYKVIFLDRDGVINKKAPEGDYIKSWKEGGADIFLDHSGSTYIIPKLSLYSTGLMPPKVILIRSSLYQ